MAGFTLSGVIRPGDNAVGIQVSGSGDMPSTKVKVSVTNNSNIATYAYQAIFGNTMNGDSVDLGSNGNGVISCQFTPMSLPVFIFPQFKNTLPGGVSPTSFTSYNESQTVLNQTSLMKVKSTSYPQSNITVTISDAGSGGPPMS